MTDGDIQREAIQRALAEDPELAAQFGESVAAKVGALSCYRWCLVLFLKLSASMVANVSAGHMYCRPVSSFASSICFVIV